MCFACRPLLLPRATPSRRAVLGGAGALAAAAVLHRPAAAQAATGPADLLIENAKIVTLDPTVPSAEAIAIRGNTIAAVGSRRDLEALRGPATTIIDAGGRTIVPGLNDSHCHFIRGGLTYSQELRWDGVPSLAMALRMLKDQALRTPAPHWVQVVGGWTGGQFAERRMPTLDEINAATGDVPCFVMHIYDRAFVNKAGLRVLGYTKDTQDPLGGLLERDAAGTPTGLVLNVANIGSLLGVFARIPKLQADDQILSTRLFMREMNRLGVTSVLDAGGGGQNYPENYGAIAKLAADRQMTLRISYSLFAQHPGHEIDDYQSWVKMVKAGEGDAFFRMLGGGEYMIWGAADQANFAKEILPVPANATDQLAQAVKLVVENGWPFRLHANYDQTVKLILDGLEKANRDVDVSKVRWAIDHAETISPESLERVAKLGGSIAIQNRMTLDGDAFAAKWGMEAAADAPPIGRIKSMGIKLAGGTDGNRATSHNPWVGLQWLVTGRTISGQKLNADRNLLERTEALRLYTEGGAWMSGEEARKGTLSPGKLADLAILSDDYMSVPEGRIGDITAVATVLDGRIVHGSGPYAGLAPAALPVAPDWLPIGAYPSYATHAAIDTPTRYAAAPLGFLDEPGPGLGPCLCGFI